MPTLLTTAADVDPTFGIALYYEKEGTGDPSVTELKQDLEYILKNYGGQKNYLHIGGPVLFVYDADDSDCSVLNRWAASGARANFYLDFKVFPGWSSCPQQPDGWHQYAPAQPHIEVAGSFGAAGSFAISPGFAHAQDTASPGAPHPHLPATCSGGHRTSGTWRRRDRAGS